MKQFEENLAHEKALRWLKGKATPGSFSKRAKVSDILLAYLYYEILLERGLSFEKKNAFLGANSSLLE